MNRRDKRRFVGKLIKLARGGRLTWEYIIEDCSGWCPKFETQLDGIKLQLPRIPYSDLVLLFVEDTDGNTTVIDEEDTPRRFSKRSLVKELWDVLWKAEWADDDARLDTMHREVLKKASKLIGLR